MLKLVCVTVQNGFKKSILVVCVIVLCADTSSVCTAETVDPQAYWTHDPSIIKSGDHYYVFSTGDELEIRRSTDLYDWEHLGSVLDEIPGWIQTQIPGVSNLWAPDVTYHNGKYYINYSGSTWGSNTSAIALLSNVTLNPADVNYEWVDEGEIISNDGSEFYNTIDGAFLKDPSGQMWLSFGSFWGGIKLTSLDSTTLKPDTPGPTLYDIAWRPSPPHAIEAPYVIYRNGYYYLFVNWDFCCDGASSTYKIMMGRSTNVTGTYRAMNGVSMEDGGGTLLIGSGDRWKGPGHASIVKVNGRDFLSHHAYDADNGGAHALRIKYLNWDANQWLVLGDYVTGPIAPQGGTLAHWDFEDGTVGQELADNPSEDIVNGYLIYGYDADLGPQYSGDTSSGSGLSINCDGTEDGYTLDPNLNGWSPITWTIEVSVKLSDVNGWQTIIGRDGSSQGESASDFYLQKNGVVDPNFGVPGAFRLNFDTIGSDRYILDSNFAAIAGRWYHLAVVSDGNTVKMYADKTDGKGYKSVGSLEMNGVTDAYNAIASSAYNWTFGRGWFDGNFVDHIDGNLDDMRFSNDALTPVQFLHYNPVIITETDDSTEVIEHGPTTDTFYLRLYLEPGGPAIEDNITVDISTDGQVEVEPLQMIFTPSTWDTNQPVTVTAVDDEALESDPHLSHISFSVTSDDSRYDDVPIPDLLASVYDDECGAWGFMSYDLNFDCYVKFDDLSLLAFDWMQNIEDLQQFANEWLSTTEPYVDGAVKN